jgi:hypothetical protein
LCLTDQFEPPLPALTGEECQVGRGVTSTLHHCGGCVYTHEWTSAVEGFGHQFIHVESFGLGSDGPDVVVTLTDSDQGHADLYYEGEANSDLTFVFDKECVVAVDGSLLDCGAPTYVETATLYPGFADRDGMQLLNSGNAGGGRWTHTCCSGE